MTQETSRDSDLGTVTGKDSPVIHEQLESIVGKLLCSFRPPEVTHLNFAFFDLVWVTTLYWVLGPVPLLKALKNTES